MSCLPIPLNSASVNWRDPVTTNPPGRLVADAKNYAYGGLRTVDNPTGLLGPDGQPLCGQSVNLCGLTQSGPEPDGTNPATTGVQSPPAGYANTLRVDPDTNCLWNDQRVTYYTPRIVTQNYSIQSIVGPSGSRNLAAPFANCVTNTTDNTCLVERKVKVLNAALLGIPAAAGAGATIDFEVALPEYDVTIDVDPNTDTDGAHTHPTSDGKGVPQGPGTASLSCRQIHDCRDSVADVLYYVQVDGGYNIHVVEACTGGCDTNTIDHELGPILLGPGDSYTMTLEPWLLPLVEPVGPYTINPGIVSSWLQMVCLPPGSEFLETPECS